MLFIGVLGGGGGTAPAAGGQITGQSVEQVAQALAQAIDQYLAG